MEEWKLWAPGYMTYIHLQSTCIWNEQQKRMAEEYSKYNYLYCWDQYLRNHANTHTM